MADLVIGGILLNNLKGIPIIKIAITIGMVKMIYIHILPVDLPFLKIPQHHHLVLALLIL